MYLSTAVLAVLVGLLTLSTTVSYSPGIFFALVLLNGVAQAAAGSYLQTAVVAIASLFGSAAMQATMSGQAFVGVVVSGVQLLSAAASLRAANAATAQNVEYDEGAAEARAAALFFGISTLFLCATLGTQAWLAKMPAYRAVMKPIEDAKRAGEDEAGPLDFKHEKGRILRVARANAEYEVAVAYVFAVTLVSYLPTMVLQVIDKLFRQYSLLSQRPFNRRIPLLTHCFLRRLIFSSSTAATSLVGTSVQSHGFLCGPHAAYWYFRLHAPYSFLFSSFATCKGRLRPRRYPYPAFRRIPQLPLRSRPS